jgi:hypothetical protein
MVRSGAVQPKAYNEHRDRAARTLPRSGFVHGVASSQKAAAKFSAGDVALQ